MLRRTLGPLAAAAASATATHSPLFSSPTETPEDISVYLKPSSSPRRRPSFYIPRMRDPAPAATSALIRADGLGSALPLFGILSPSCDYYALRLPLLKSGFKRLPTYPLEGIPCNVLWGKSMQVRRHTDGPGGRGNRSGDPYCALLVRGPDGTVFPHRIANHLQRFNHFPLSHQHLGCKRGLARQLHITGRRVTAELGPSLALEKYSFTPATWIYPQDRELLLKVFKAAPSSAHFIWKPARGSCGRGICFSCGGARNATSWERVMEDIDAHANDPVHGRMFRQYVVQRYIESPLLLDGRKMDLRLYVAVTSFSPLVVYLYEEGLVRLAAEAYESGAEATVDLGGTGRFRHLTNYSIGRKYRSGSEADEAERTGNSTVTEVPPSSDEQQQQGGVGGGSAEVTELKWSLARLWAHLDNENTESNNSGSDLDRHCISCGTPVSRPLSLRVKEEIALLIVRTLMAAKPAMTTARRTDSPAKFFEVYGFDVMLDAALKPLLVEVNTLPSLESSSTFDYCTKSNMISDLLNLVMLEPFERELGPLLEMGTSRLQVPISREMRDCVHSLGDVDKITNDIQSDNGTATQRDELRWRLRDELAYARGFQRIFPPPPPALDGSTPYPIPAHSKTMREDIEMYTAVGLLGESDHWALESDE